LTGRKYGLKCIESTVNFDTIPVAAGGFIAKFDSSGKCIWAKNKFAYDPATSTVVLTYGIKVIDHKIFVCGCTPHSGDITVDTITLTHPGVVSSMVLCFDSTCNIQWITEGVSKSTLSYSNFGTDREGNIYYTGCFRDTITFPGNRVITWPGIKDMFFVKLSKDGVVNWVRQIRPSSAEGKAVITDANGNTYITGYFKGVATFGDYQLTSLTSSDMFLARYDSAGNCMGVKQFANGYGTGLSQDASGDPNFLFLFERTTHFGDSTYTSYGYTTDIVYARCSAVTGAGESKSNVENKLVIYANPTAGRCNITIPDEFINQKKLTLQIFDSMGRLVQQTQVEITDRKLKLNMKSQAKGIYNAILSNGLKSYSGKIVIR